MTNLNDIFDDIYNTQKWCGGGSGNGSTIMFNTDTYIPFIRNYIDTHNITSICDIGSGDCQCLYAMYGDKNVKYTGYDCSKRIITYTKSLYESDKYRFELIDGNESVLYMKKKVDLIIIKDVLQHWSTDRIVSFLRDLSEKVSFKKCILVNDLSNTVTPDIHDGEWRCINWNSACFREFSFEHKLIYGNGLVKEVVEFLGIKPTSSS